MTNTKNGILAAIVLTAAVAATPVLADDWDGCQSGDPATVVQACTAIVDTNPDNVNNLAAALVLRAKAFTARKQYDRASADLGRAIALRPDNPQAYLARGRVHEELGAYSKAKEDYDEAVRLFDDRSSVGEVETKASLTTPATAAGDEPGVIAQGDASGTVADETAAAGPLLPPAKPEALREEARAAALEQERDERAAREQRRTHAKPAPRKTQTQHRPAPKRQAKSQPRPQKPQEDIRAKVNNQIACKLNGGFNC